MRTRNEQLYHLYRPNSQRSLRDREHFDNAWNLQQEIPRHLTGETLSHIDSIWVNYTRTNSGGFIITYTVFSGEGHKLYFQNLTRLTDIDQVIEFLRKNLTIKLT